MPERAFVHVVRSNLRRALRARNVEEARDLLARLKEEDPLSAETRGFELELFVVTRHWDEAETLAAQLLAFFPSSARIQYLAGRVEYQRKNYSRAEERFEEADHLHPHWLTRRWRGKALTQSGDYERAEATLLGLAAEHPEVRLDLAWLYERREDPHRALEQLQIYLERHPENELARVQLRRLRARVLAPGELVEEIDSLLDLGERPAPELIPPYVQRLLESGQGAAARRFVQQHEHGWTPREAASVAWVCYKRQAHDLALRLFLRAIDDLADDYKLLSALESAARQCARSDEVIAAYERLVPRYKNLYGRLRSLRRRKPLR